MQSPLPESTVRTEQRRKTTSRRSGSHIVRRFSLSFKFLSSQWFLGFMFLLLLFLALVLGQETYRKYQITQEIQKQQDSISHLERDNQELEDLVAYLKTDNYRERVARERLGLQRDGEQVVVVPEVESSVDLSRLHVVDDRSNAVRWWDYFFSYE